MSHQPSVIAESQSPQSVGRARSVSTAGNDGALIAISTVSFACRLAKSIALLVLKEGMSGPAAVLSRSIERDPWILGTAPVRACAPARGRLLWPSNRTVGP